MKRRTTRVTIGMALLGLWVGLVGLLIGSAAAEAMSPMAVIAAAIARAVS